jgi:hypothetical protein
MSELLHKPEPKIIRPFSDEVFQDLANHVKEIRRIFDMPGSPYHDKDAPDADKFNRWYWHNLPLLKKLHNSRALMNLACDTFGVDLKPSYVFLSMYGPEGVCPLHQDRPQCQYTMDLLIHGGEEWPIYVDEKPYISVPGEALCYSGTGQPHYRKPMKEDSKAVMANLAFFHFVPSDWDGKLE